MKASDLPESTKQELLNQIRGQIGSEQYRSLVNNLGEDGLIDFVLAKMADSDRPPPVSRYVSTKPTRTTSAIAGFVFGGIVGLIFLGLSWMVKITLDCPYWYSTASMINGAGIVILSSLFIAWQNADTRRVDFRGVVRFYIFISLLGGLIGIVHHTFELESSLAHWLSDDPNRTAGIAAIIAVIVVLLSRGTSDWGCVYGAVLFLFAISSMFLLDAPSFTPWFTMEIEAVSHFVSNNAGVFIPSLMACVSGLVGLILPPTDN